MGQEVSCFKPFFFGDRSWQQYKRRRSSKNHDSASFTPFSRQDWKGFSCVQKFGKKGGGWILKKGFYACIEARTKDLHFGFFCSGCLSLKANILKKATEMRSLHKALKLQRAHKLTSKATICFATKERRKWMQKKKTRRKRVIGLYLGNRWWWKWRRRRGETDFPYLGVTRANKMRWLCGKTSVVCALEFLGKGREEKKTP